MTERERPADHPTASRLICGQCHATPRRRQSGTVGTMITLYGIKNCDTMKKAWSWLDAHKVPYTFHDYRVSGVDRAHIEAWCRELGWEKVLNKASTTFRDLPEADRQGLDETKAIALMLAQPTMIKRPVLDLGERRILAFKPDVYAAAFARR